MNFLMRSTASVYSERSSIPEPRVDTHRRSMTVSCLETVMMSEDPFDSSITGLDSTNDLPVVEDKHLDVSDEEGCIAIPYSMYSLNLFGNGIFLIVLHDNIILEMVSKFGSVLILIILFFYV